MIWNFTERVIYLNDSWKLVSLDNSTGFNFVHFKPVHGVDVEVKTIGDFPYITRTALNNGVNGFLDAEAVNESNINKGNCISFGAETGRFFYQKVDFVAGNKMYGLYHSELTEKSGIILIACLTKALSSMFAYGFGMIPKRIEGKRIKLPVKSDGNVDFGYLESMYDSLVDSLSLPSLTTKKTIHSLDLNSKSWKQFKVSDILTVDSGVRLTKENMVKGDIPFIGASSSGNGITNWVSNKNKSLDSNVLGVNYNGSVVDNFYHPYKALFSDDVKRIHIKDKSVDANIYKYIFLKVAFLQHKEQYQYGYKFDANRMKNQKLVLPVDDNGNPDWQFMEDYIKSMPNGDLL
ncbi:restriction endonuclease [Ligilactobacillus agilis]|uniref:Restriction endonuclease n=1 Tax=Ligilactobacillus agilis TaxID=1601 RepID=A0A2I2ACG5_9LACO|nr:restriction endonuclease [Ligilactobacillus agilis]PLA83319.1 restriction endonuclease [Ligilactobacillus agilis]